MLGSQKQDHPSGGPQGKGRTDASVIEDLFEAQTVRPILIADAAE